MEVEIVDDDEFDLIEVACLQAEQNVVQSSHESKPKKPRFLPSSLASVPPAPPFPFLIYRGKTTYCREVSEIDHAAAFLMAVGATAIGCDVEWRVTYERGKPPRPIALMQLCVLDPSIYMPDGGTPYHCFLLHINRSGTSAPALPLRLLELLTSETVHKAGIGIHGDSLKLEHDYGIKMKGLIDLSEVANTRLCSTSLPPQKWSLAALTEKLINKTVKKSQHIRCSDWEKDPLTLEQRTYAATDAWVSLRLYEILASMPITWQLTAVLPTATAREEPSKATVADNNCINNIIIDQEKYIPACKEPAVLQPAKIAVLQQHYQGIGIEEIAAQRQIQPSTVQSYLAEAIIAGYAYNWNLLCVQNEIISLVAEVARKAGVVLPPLAGSTNEEEKVDYTPGFDVLNAVLQARDIKIRALFEEMEPKVPGLGFGDLRLAFAHVGRNVIE